MTPEPEQIWLETLPEAAWHLRRDAHLARVQPVLQRLRGFYQRGPHPVYDFLRTYYSFALSQLESWSPGAGMVLQGGGAVELYGQQRFWASDATIETAWLDLAQFPAHRRQGLDQVIHLLEQTAARPAAFGCFGLHEWAMVYRPEAGIRYQEQGVPLRLPPDELARFVDSMRIRCSHFDAFRFFTPAGKPLNALQPRHDDRPAFEQPGCLHANMDLYKWAYKFHPWVPSELLADTFLLALEIRELDMRASPYDLREYGFTPVAIETPEGRADYEAQQRAFTTRAEPLRAALLAALTRFRDLAPLEA